MNKRLSRTGPKITKHQKLKLLEMMKNSPELEYGNRGVNYMKNSLARDGAIRRWKEIARELNYMDGTVHKEWKSWKKTWSDIRSKMQQDWSSVVEAHLNQSKREESSLNPFLDDGSKKLSYISEMFCDADDDHTKDERQFGEFNESSSFLHHSFQSNDRLKNYIGHDKDIESQLNSFNGLSKTEYNNESEYNDPSVIQMNSNRLRNLKYSSNNNNFSRRKESSANHKKQKLSLSHLMNQYMDHKVKIKEEYYSKKLCLLERDVIAKESIASSLRMLVEGRSDLFQLP